MNKRCSLVLLLSLVCTSAIVVTMANADDKPSTHQTDTVKPMSDEAQQADEQQKANAAYLKHYEENRLAIKQRYQDHLMIDNAEPEGEYRPSPESKVQTDIPQGVITQYSWNNSKIFKGSERDYWVYVPAQYDPNTPTALMVFQDGAAFLDNTVIATIPVLDNLIHRGEIPVMIGLFVNSGKHPDEPVPANIAYQTRQVEYDTQSDRYARLLIEEIIPAVKKHHNITDDPNQRAIGGSSSGAMAAWTVAWERPDQFRKVLSFIGSFADVHGGHNAPFKVRKEPPKPIRIFLQSGSDDHNIEYGDWALANQTMASALAFANYDYRFVYGNGQHDAKHANAILPDALRWLWRK